jgi:hypothetical protein
MKRVEWSRPAALAGQLAEIEVGKAIDLFATKRVTCRLDPDLSENLVAHATLLLAANQILRFCPNLTVVLPGPARPMLEPRLRQLAASIHPAPTIRSEEVVVSDATLNIGHSVRDEPNWVAINGDGWLARVATSAQGVPVPELPPGFTRRGVVGGLAAACLGAGQVFTALVGRPLLPRPCEISLFTLEQAEPRDLDPGPQIAIRDVELDVLLIGCGGVANGWVYAAREAGSCGRVEAVDHQAQRPENIGPYVCASRARIGTAKAKIVKDELDVRMDVTPRTERFRFYKARIGYGQTYIPNIVLSAVDNAPTRRDVQRLWAQTTIDLAAEELTSQVIVKRLDDEGQCLLDAYTDPTGDDDELAALAEATGLSPDRLRDFETPITADDVAAAPPDKRDALEHGRARGQLVCGRVGDLDLHEEGYSDDFRPAAPFVTCFTGVVAYAQTLCAQTEQVESLHFQFNFGSYRSRVLRIACRRACMCSTYRTT